MPLWLGNRMAVTAPAYCWQVDPQVGIPVSGSEDCLYLNLYRPVQAAKDNKPLPVLVYLHGGGFYSGINSEMLYGPDYLMATGEVILVVPTYRTNAFGFLATGDEASPGNYGLKDQTLALQWVRDHVTAFGGDANSVTLVGHSAGAVSASFHLISKLSKGLFRNAILLSGAIDTKWGMPMRNPRQFVNRHAAALGIADPEKMSSQELVDKLREIPAQELVAASLKLKEWDILPVTDYLPAVEPKDTPEAFLTCDPKEALEKGDFQQVPLFTNVLPNDGVNFIQPLLTAGEKYKDFNDNIHKLLPVILYMDGGNANIKEIVDKIRFKYFGSTGLINGEEGLDGVQKMSMDYFFGKPMFWFVQQMAKKNEKPTFVSQWNYEGLNTMGLVYTRYPRKYKATHGDELLHLFRIRMIFPENQLSADDRKAQAVLMRHILDFAKNDCPGFEEWKKDNPKMVVFRNDKSTAIAKDIVNADPEAFNYKFWEEVEDLYNKGDN